MRRAFRVKARRCEESRDVTSKMLIAMRRVSWPASDHEQAVCLVTRAGQVQER